MVVMPEYLKASTKQTASKPRIISEVKKNCLNKLKLGFTTSLQDFGKSKFSGQLLWNKGNSNEWALRLAEVRHGCLILIDKDSSAVELRLPLRELNLRPCNAPKTFCLTEAKGLRLSIFQALTEEEYEKWVRILAVELIRQTPLQNVRFLDILSIIRHKESQEGGGLRRGRSEECLSKVDDNLWENRKCVSMSRPPLTKGSNMVDVNGNPPNRKESGGVQRAPCDFRKMKIQIRNSMPAIFEVEKQKWMRTQSMNNLSINPRETSDESGISSGDEIQVEPIPRNAEDFSFVPVRERKKFFESLNSSRQPDFRQEELSLSRSSSIGNLKNAELDRFKPRKRKRTKSLHDLHKTPVREICQMFESREEEPAEGKTTTIEKNGVSSLTERRLQRGERKLDKLRNQIADVEESINVIAKDLKAIGRRNLKRQEGLDLHVALQRRLDEENSRLERLMEETARVIKGNQRIIMKLERCTEKCSQ